MTIPMRTLETEDLDRLRKGSVSAAEYIPLLQGLQPGQGGLFDVEEVGIKRPALKNRLTAAATQAGVVIRFMRSSPTQVIFEVLPPGTIIPKRKGGPGRPKKSPGA